MAVAAEKLVLGPNASPRPSGNTGRLVAEILKGAESAGFAAELHCLGETKADYQCAQTEESRGEAQATNEANGTTLRCRRSLGQPRRPNTGEDRDTERIGENPAERRVQLVDAWQEIV